MSTFFRLSEPQGERMCPHFHVSHSTPGIDDRRVLSGILRVIRNGMR